MHERISADQIRRPRDSQVAPDPGVDVWSTAGDVCILELRGECDLLCIPDLERALQAALRLRLRRFVVDLTEATLLDCAAWGTLLTALGPSTQRPGGGLVACGARDRVARFLSVLPPERTVTLYDTRRAAVTHLTEPGTSAALAASDLVGWALEQQRLAALGLDATWARNGLL